MKNSLLVHKHLIIRAEAIKPPLDEEQLQNWLMEFIESINIKIIKIFVEPVDTVGDNANAADSYALFIERESSRVCW